MKQSAKMKIILLCLIVFVSGTSAQLTLNKTNSDETAEQNQEKRNSDFPDDFFSDEVRKSGGIIVHFLILTYCCLGLAVVCDNYFLKALEFISHSLKLPSDIAGATFLAIGTSAPELFTSIIGVFAGSDIGIGTIVGSAVFNLIAIPAVCGFVAYFFLDEMPKISSFPIIRDSLFYIVTIIALVLSIKDNSVDWIESLLLLSLFVVYIVIMFYNAQLANLIQDKTKEYKTILNNDEKIPLLKKPKKSSIEDEEASQDLSHIVLIRGQNGYKEVRNIHKIEDEESSDQEEDEDEDDWTDNNCFCKWLLMPLKLLFRITIPKPTKYCFAITFTVSIIWIVGLTYLSVWMVTTIGYTFGIPDSVSGITILAAGTSIPELITCFILVKKRSEADMAICNSLGSNIFDILFCLGLPWLIKSFVQLITEGSGFATLVASSIPIESEALPFTTMTLFVTTFILLFTMRYSDWQLGLQMGIICSITYLAFVIVSTIMELSI